MSGHIALLTEQPDMNICKCQMKQAYSACQLTRVQSYGEIYDNLTGIINNSEIVYIISGVKLLLPQTSTISMILMCLRVYVTIYNNKSLLAFNQRMWNALTHRCHGCWWWPRIYNGNLTSGGNFAIDSDGMVSPTLWNSKYYKWRIKVFPIWT